MSFERLEQSVTIIARHTVHLGRHEAISDYLGEIEGR
jgi:hypothetical protein